MYRTTTLSLALCLTLAYGCSSKTDPEPTTPTTDPAAKTAEPKATATTQPAADASVAKDPEAERQEVIKTIAERRAKDEAKAAEELARWTDDMRAQVKKLIAKKYKSPRKALEAILASPHRVPGHSDRDVHRHPIETLLFFGIKPDMTVVEAGPGRGWYSEILGPFLAKKGKLVLVDADPNGPEDSYGILYGLRVKDFMDKSPEIYGTAEFVGIDPPDTVSFGAPGSADMVLVFRELHNWYRGEEWDVMMAAARDVLKPGGVLAIVQHRADPGSDPKESAPKGRLAQEWVVAEIEKLGFKLEASSEINANPKDTRDQEEGVWTLPPSYRLGEQDKEKYQAIGESDRMTLKFKKLAK